MKKRRPPSRVRATAAGPRWPELPALRDFARGYLHEDVLVEHGGALGAAADFSNDASADEVRALAADLAALLSAAGTWSSDALEDYFTRTLRSAWRPRSLADLRALESAVRRYRT